MKTNTQNTESKDTMKITESAFYEMVDYIGLRPAESGGVFFGNEKDNVIRRFVPDEDAKTTRASYTINTDFLNPIIKKLWAKEDLSLLGIVHSHPRGSKYLSSPDRSYFSSLLKNLPRTKFYTPIVFTIPDGGLKIFPYVYENGSNNPETVHAEIVSDDYEKQDEVQTSKKPKEPKKAEEPNEKEKAREVTKTKKTEESEISKQPQKREEVGVNEIFLIVYPKEKIEKAHSFQSDRTKEILLIALSIVLFFSIAFIITLHIMSVFFQSLFKIIVLWN